MKKNLIIICYWVCLIGFFTIFLSCDAPANEPVTPKIVRKQIRAAASSKKSVSPRKKSVGPSQAPQKSTRPSSGNQASVSPVLAQKSEPATEKAAETKTRKPSLKPKSDISTTRTQSRKQPGAKTAASQPETAPSASRITVASASSEGRPLYNPKGKIDPFEPLFREKPTEKLSKKKRKRRVPRTPLEKIDLSQLKLVGIILASSGNRALVEESNGKGYVIKKGTFIGTNAGRVVQIEKDKVIVAEEYEDVLGNVTQRNRELKLPKPPGEF